MLIIQCDYRGRDRKCSIQHRERGYNMTKLGRIKFERLPAGWRNTKAGCLCPKHAKVK
jgi:hypothetical protein